MVLALQMVPDQSRKTKELSVPFFALATRELNFAFNYYALHTSAFTSITFVFSTSLRYVFFLECTDSELGIHSDEDPNDGRATARFWSHNLLVWCSLLETSILSLR